MALLQIAEPGQSTEPHRHRLAIGIDLGTTNSLVATVRSGVPTVLPDAQGRALLPSIVRYLPGGKVEVGYAAQAHQADDPKNSIASVKRFMGRGLKDVAYAVAPRRPAPWPRAPDDRRRLAGRLTALVMGCR